MGKNILTLLGLSAAMSATDAAIQKKVHGLGNSQNPGTKTVRFPNKDLDNFEVLMKGITETLKNDIKKEVLCL